MEYTKNKLFMFSLLGLMIVIAVLLGLNLLKQSNNSQQAVDSSTESSRESERSKAMAMEGRKHGGSDTDPYEKNEVKNTILKGAADFIQICFKDWMKTPEAKKFEAGRVTIDWQISAEGKVLQPEIVSSEIPKINDCVVNNIAKLQFPPPPGEKKRYIVHKFFFKKE